MDIFNETVFARFDSTVAHMKFTATAQDPTSQNTSMNGGGTYEVPPQPEELLTTGGFWGNGMGSCQFSSGMQTLRNYS